MDFKMDKSSYGMLVFILATFLYFLMSGMDLTFGGSLQAFAIALLVLVALLALMSIPVLIYCYFVNKIPDIDYSIRAAFAFTIVGIISELI
jgi:hypothetical protein